MLQFFAKRLKELHEVERNERGFTLIELLVVVIIIGILAAIAIPTFIEQRERAWESAAQSDLRNAAAAATSCASNAGGSYAACAVANLGAFGFNQSQDVNVVAGSETVAANRWAVTFTHGLDDGTQYRFDTNPPAGGGPRGRVYCVAGTPDC